MKNYSQAIIIERVSNGYLVLMPSRNQGTIPGSNEFLDKAMELTKKMKQDPGDLSALMGNEEATDEIKKPVLPVDEDIKIFSTFTDVLVYLSELQKTEKL